MTSHEISKKIEEWLLSDEKNLEAGASLLIQINRNKILHQSILRRKDLAKLEYELKKGKDLLDARLRYEDYKSLTDEQVATFDAKVKVVKAETFPKIEQQESADNKGKRADHDQLPDEAKAAFEDNLKHYQKMRALHEKLKLMNNDAACDRYPFLSDLIKYDEKVRANWEIYDNAQVLPNDPTKTGDNPGAKSEETTKNTENTNPIEPIDAKRVSANRAYISRNKSKLQGLRRKDEEKYNSLFAEIQNRITELIQAKQTFDENTTKELIELGFKVGLDE